MFDHDFVVIGSGFGGSVSALRLTEKGYRVAFLERGQGVVFRCHVVVPHERLRGAANDPIEDGRQVLVSRRRDRDEARRAGAPHREGSLEAAADGRLLGLWQTAALAMERAHAARGRQGKGEGPAGPRPPRGGDREPRGPAAGKAAVRRRGVAEGTRAPGVRRVVPPRNRNAPIREPRVPARLHRRGRRVPAPPMPGCVWPA